MYVCTTHELVLSDGRRPNFGDVVPEIDSWPPMAIRTHLNLGRIKKVESSPVGVEVESIDDLIGEEKRPENKGPKRKKGR